MIQEEEQQSNTETAAEVIIEGNDGSNIDNNSRDESSMAEKQCCLWRVKSCLGNCCMKYWKGFLFMAALSSTSTIATTFFQDEITEGAEFLGDSGFGGVVLYLLIFTLLLQVGIPATVMEIASAFIFEEYYQILLINTLAKNIAKPVGYFIGKYLIYNWVKRNLLDDKLAVVRALEKLMKREPLKYATLWGFAYIPAWTQTLALPVLGLAFIPFVITHNASGIIYSVIWAFVGIRTRDAINEAQEDEDVDFIEITVTVVGVIFLLLTVVFIGTYVKKEIQREGDEIDDNENEAQGMAATAVNQGSKDGQELEVEL